MKKYFVVRVYENFAPSIVFNTDIFEDAMHYADIMRRTDGAPYEILARVNYE